MVLPLPRLLTRHSSDHGMGLDCHTSWFLYVFHCHNYGSIYPIVPTYPTGRLLVDALGELKDEET